MSIPLVEPRDGLPPLCESPDQFHEALARLEAGNGPLAIDTERASGIRYGNRAFLVQIRRAGCGTVLFDAEQHRTELGEILKPLLNSTTWILHAAVSDLPSLQNFGWFPTRLFDTEVAGRLAGFDRVNLAAMVEKVLGLHLAKGLAQSDWSRRPIPAAWLTYAALDVEVLLELADSMAAILTADGKTAWAEQEFEHIRLQARQPQAESTWQDMKGISVLTRPPQLAVAQALWTTREAIALRKDLSPGRVLRNRVLLDVARTLPTSPVELAKIPGFPKNKGAAYRWFRVVSQALHTPREQWPQPSPQVFDPQSRSWTKHDKAAAAALSDAKNIVAEIASRYHVPESYVLPTAIIKKAVWSTRVAKNIMSKEQLQDLLAQQAVRPWQRGLVLEPLAAVLL